MKHKKEKHRLSSLAKAVPSAQKKFFFQICPKESWVQLVHCAPAWALFEYCAASAAFSHSHSSGFT